MVNPPVQEIKAPVYELASFAGGIQELQKTSAFTY